MVGHAKVYDGNKEIHNSENPLPNKRKLTKEQFTEEWNKADKEERVKLMVSIIPIV